MSAKLGQRVILLVIFLGALCVRLSGWNQVFTPEGSIFFRGADDYYHLRRTILTTLNFPHVSSFDSYVNYPEGGVILWPPFFDFLLASLALFLGRGSFFVHSVELAGALLPPILGALTVLPVFVIGRRLGGNIVGLGAAALLAFIPSSIFESALGKADHHVLETLLATSAFALFLTGLKKGRVLEPGLAGILLGLAILTSVSSLAFALPIIALLIAEAIFQKKIFAGNVCLGFALLTILPFVLTSHWQGYGGVFVGRLSWFQVTFLAVPIALSFLILRQKRWKLTTFFLVIGTIMVAFSPWLFKELIVSPEKQIFSTIGEVQPMLVQAGKFTLASLWQHYSLWFLVATGGLILFIYRRFWQAQKFTLIDLFLVIWTLLLEILAFNQIGFAPSFAVNIAIFGGYFLTEVGRAMLRIYPSRKWLFGPAIFIGIASLVLFGVFSAVKAGQIPPLPPGEWRDSLLWLRENTPKTSYYFDPVKKPEYGVMSPWDWGHWVVYLAQRPTIANNFQMGARKSLKFYFSSDVEEANSILKENKVRYVITEYLPFGSLRLAAFLYAGGKDLRQYEKVENSRVVPNEEFYKLIYSRLHLFNGKDLKNYKLVYESPSKQVKIFEFVKKE